MIKIKPIIFSACAAFVLSFVTALAARSGLPVSLLKAFIFGLLFGAIAVGVQFVYAKFLSEGGAAPEAAEEPKVMGSKVDLVVSEEDLADDKDSPVFYVEGKHVLSSDDVGGAQKAAPVAGGAIPAGSGAAIPAEAGAISAHEQNQALEAAEKVREQKAAENITQKAAEMPSPAAPVEEEVPQAAPEKPAFSPVNLAQGGAPASPAPSSGDEELDDLPDIGEIGGASSAETEEGVIEDSEFAEEGIARPRRQTELSDGKVADVKDAPIMAEAIRTILSSEE
ncbi:MAG: hypothetical protein IK015_01565 [Treponema sp.]|nr:hypothetical protein [Treponema sp.]